MPIRLRNVIPRIVSGLDNDALKSPAPLIIQSPSQRVVRRDPVPRVRDEMTTRRSPLQRFSDGSDPASDRQRDRPPGAGGRVSDDNTYALSFIKTVVSRSQPHHSRLGSERESERLKNSPSVHTQTLLLHRFETNARDCPGGPESLAGGPPSATVDGGEARAATGPHSLMRMRRYSRTFVSDWRPMGPFAGRDSASSSTSPLQVHRATAALLAASFLTTTSI